MIDRLEREEGVVGLDRVTIGYGGLAVLDAVSVAAAPGETLVVRGSNGSGKTTLLRLLANIVRPQEGTRWGPTRCAYAPPQIAPPRLKSKDWLALMSPDKQRQQLEALDVLSFAGNLEKPCRTLSFGNLKKVVLAEALSAGQPLILLDEPSAGLDEAGAAGLRQLVTHATEAGAAVIIAEQDGRLKGFGSRSVRVQGGGLVDNANVKRCSIQLAGPANDRERLLAEAARLGFVESE